VNTPIINRKIYDHIESNIVYPTHDDYKWIAKLDPEYVKEQLNMLHGVKYINNKYVVLMPIHDGQLWYQHDNITWLIEPKK
jgi:hypothetical protein